MRVQARLDEQDAGLMYRMICEIGSGLRLLPLLGRLNSRRIPVLMYHGVHHPDKTPFFEEERHLHVPRDVFYRQMQVLRKRYHPVSLSEALDRLSGRMKDGGRCVAVTFDDGYLNNYLHAYPACQELGIPFTVYVATDFIDGNMGLWPHRIKSALTGARVPRLDVSIGKAAHRLELDTPQGKNRAYTLLVEALKDLDADEIEHEVETLANRMGADTAAEEDENSMPASWAQLKEMAHSGLVEIGSHTAGHRILTRLSPGRLGEELDGSKKRIEDRVGSPCLHFAYPNGKRGDFDGATEKKVREAGFLSAVTTLEGFNALGCDPYALKRFGVYGHYGMAEFEAAVTGFHGLLGWMRK